MEILVNVDNCLNGSLAVDSLFYVSTIVYGGSVFVFVLVCITLCHF